MRFILTKTGRDIEVTVDGDEITLEDQTSCYQVTFELPELLRAYKWASEDECA